MTRDRRLDAVLVAASLVALVVVAVDVEGPVRAVVGLGFVLLVPGFALARAMGPMSPAARALVTVAAGLAVATMVAVLLVAAGVWSPVLAVALLAGVVVAATWLGAADRPVADRPPTTRRTAPLLPTHGAHPDPPRRPAAPDPARLPATPDPPPTLPTDDPYSPRSA